MRNADFRLRIGRLLFRNPHSAIYNLGSYTMDERPKLRYVDAFPVEVEGQKLIYLRDPEGFSDQGMAVPYHVYYLLTLFDGEHSVLDLQEAYARKFNGVLAAEEQIGQLVQQLDGAYLLDSERFQAFRREVETQFRAAPIRQAAHAGASYPDDAAALRNLIGGFFEPPEGPGAPVAGNGTAPLRALVAPHIDFRRGGPCFAWAYRALAEAPPPDLFVVFGTGHSTSRPFVLSRKDFETPLGTLKADQDVIDRLVRYADQDLFEDEFAHRSEHSIEFQTVFLKYLYPEREIRFVPILCGSFHESIVGKRSPLTSPLISNFLSALRQALDESGRQVCFVAGVDLSHVGARFGDTDPLSDAFIEGVERTDREVLEAAEAMDPEGFFEVIARECDHTRVCGTSSIYTMLHAMDAERGELLKHDRTIDQEAQSLVSFASMAFY